MVNLESNDSIILPKTQQKTGVSIKSLYPLKLVYSSTTILVKVGCFLWASFNQQFLIDWVFEFPGIFIFYESLFWSF